MSTTGAQPVLAGMLPCRRLGRTGFEVTVVGVGGWLGILDDRDATAAQKEAAAVDAVRRAVDLGVNYFDTSPMYSRGPAERHLGLGLRSLAKEERAQLRIATKTGTHPDRAYRYDADSTSWTVENSLRVLFTDHVDVLLIHAPRDDADMDIAMGPGGALAMQFSLRNPYIAVTLAAPRTAAEVEGNVRHALTTLPDDLRAEFDRFFPTLPPPAPGGEAQA